MSAGVGTFGVLFYMALAICSCAKTGDLYTLRLSDGREKTDLSGVSGCLNAFSAAVHGAGTVPQAFCFPQQKKGMDPASGQKEQVVYRVLSLQDVSGEDLGLFSEAGVPRKTTWEEVPPWGRGLEYGQPKSF